MRRGRGVIGLPVVSLTTGKELGYVKDLVWSHEQRKLTGIGVDGKGAWNSEKMVSFDDIASIGQDAITVADSSGLQRKGRAGGRACGRSLDSSSGALVVTETGRNLGTMQDLVFDEDSGELIGYEVSAGLVGDLITGRDLLPPQAVLVWGAETVVVQDLEVKKGED